MTPAGWNGAQPAPREPGGPPGTAGPAGTAGPGTRSGGVLRTVWWASMPVWSIGFLSFVPFLAYAVIQQRKRDWVVFAAYLAATIAMVVTIGVVNSNSNGSAAVGGFVIALAGCAAVHATILFRPARSVAPLALGPRQRNREAVAQAQGRIERRKDARHLLKTNPGLARDLRIGRPDLPRDYDDGGLVDVNHVPGTVLAAGLGLTPAEVSDVLAARDKLGRFASAEEMCAYTSLSPDRVDELREEMIFG
jgi:hypothetical protein